MIKDKTIEKVYNFRKERDWNKFHNIKDLAISISIEAAELLECFQWKSIDKHEAYNDPELLSSIKEEIADILIYNIYLAKELKLDLDEVINDKIEKNKNKYPIDKCKGNCKKYTKIDNK